MKCDELTKFIYYLVFPSVMIGYYWWMILEDQYHGFSTIWGPFLVKHPRTPLSPYLEWDIGVQNEASQQNCCLATSSLGKISAPTKDVFRA